MAEEKTTKIWALARRQDIRRAEAQWLLAIPSPL